MKESCQWQDPHKEAKTLQQCPYNLLVIIYEGKTKQQKPHVQAVGSAATGMQEDGAKIPHVLLLLQNGHAQNQLEPQLTLHPCGEAQISGHGRFFSGSGLTH